MQTEEQQTRLLRQFKFEETPMLVGTLMLYEKPPEAFEEDRK